MGGVFPRWSNTVFWIVVVCLGLILLGTPAFLMIYVRTPQITGQFKPLKQPVEFDHRHHVRDDGIQCLYCHSLAEKSATAGIPSTDVCMGCHSQIWNESTLLEPVRDSFFSGRPIRWNRVHDLPDFVFFNHSIHVSSGIDCRNCHGMVGTMARVYQVEKLTMGWCLDCHRNPEQFLGPAADQPALGDEEAHISGVNVRGAKWRVIPPSLTHGEIDEAFVPRRITCSACHR